MYFPILNQKFLQRYYQAAVLIYQIPIFLKLQLVVGKKRINCAYSFKTNGVNDVSRKTRGKQFKSYSEDSGN